MEYYLCEKLNNNNFINGIQGGGGSKRDIVFHYSFEKIEFMKVIVFEDKKLKVNYILMNKIFYLQIFFNFYKHS